MKIEAANATKTGGEIIEDLKVPSGKIDIIIRFEIDSDETTYLLIDMEADWVAISQSNRLRPIFKATVAEPQQKGQWMNKRCWQCFNHFFLIPSFWCLHYGLPSDAHLHGICFQQKDVKLLMLKN
jgi:hypothetical protein